MSVPILLVTGFLGAGKTTHINALLQADHGLRIAAIVNDFGSINIDEKLLGSASDTVIGLKNGCICCSLQGDLLRTLKQVLAQPGVPDLIVIEASGVADPAGIVDALIDPVIWHSASLDTVVCIVDAEDIGTSDARAGDDLWLAQVKQSDVICLSRTQCVEPGVIRQVRDRMARMGKRHVFDATDAALSLASIMAEPRSRRDTAGTRAPIDDHRFSYLEWEQPGPIRLDAFQAAIGQVSGQILRAKGFLQFQDHPGRTFVFQMTGKRATLAAHDGPAPSTCQLVLIGEKKAFDVAAARQVLDGMATSGTGAIDQIVST